MKQYRNKIIAGFFILSVLALAFWWDGDSPGLKSQNPQSALTSHATASPALLSTQLPTSGTALEDGQQSEQAETPLPSPEQTADNSAFTEPPPENETGAFETSSDTSLSTEEKTNLALQIAGDSSPEAIQEDEAYSKDEGMHLEESTGKDQYHTNPVPAGKPIPVEPQNAVITDKELTCTFSVRCDSILEHPTRLAPDKADIIPPDGIIYEQRTVSFYEGESVFDLLLREMKNNKIHLEFTSTPMNNSAYIEGINNIYEFDCGELSGWIYKVNGWVPNYGSSRYQLKEGDKVEWVYTCELGADVNGFSR